MESNNHPEAQPAEWTLDAEVRWTSGPLAVDAQGPIDVPFAPTLEPVPGAVLTESELPESRIRFTAPAEIRVEGFEESVPAAVLNVSRGGVALVGDCELTPGQRLWARFRLGLTDAPVDYLCAVAWRKSDGQQNLYGCEFSSLTEDEIRSLDRLVEARTRGLETEWSLPEPLELKHEESEPFVELSRPPESNPHGHRPWRQPSKRAIWIVGALVGFGLALVAGRALTDGIFDAPGTDETATVAKKLPIRIDNAEPDSVEDEEVAVAPAPLEQPGEEPQMEDRVREAPGTEGLAESKRAELLRDTTRGVEVELRADGPADSYTSFWLENPKRFVVDVQGRDSGFESASVAFAHPLISRMRIGRHSDKVRYVLEVASEVVKVEAARVENNSLWLELIRSN